MNTATAKPVRKHNCKAESNVVHLGIESQGAGVMVSTFGCRRCPNRWTETYDPAVAEAERLAAGRAWVAEAAERLAREAALERWEAVR